MSSNDLRADADSGVTHWGYEELNKAAEISRAAGPPIHAHFGPAHFGQAHFGQMWALPLETGALGNGVDAGSSGAGRIEDLRPMQPEAPAP